MRTLRTMLILLMTLGLLTLGAGLPKLVGMMTDRETINRPGYQAMRSVALDLSGERRYLSTAGKIVLLSRCETFNVTEKETSMTEAEVNAALISQMEEYAAAGVFAWFDHTSWVLQPKLCIDPDAPDNYGIFWTVTIVNNQKPYESLNVDIDDETGRIYSIRYDLYGEYSLDGGLERNFATMDAFVHVYLNQLGLYDAEQDLEPNIEYGELDGDVLYGSFSFTDGEYGEIAIEFYVTRTGSLSVYFPE